MTKRRRWCSLAEVLENVENLPESQPYQHPIVKENILHIDYIMMR